MHLNLIYPVEWNVGRNTNPWFDINYPTNSFEEQSKIYVGVIGDSVESSNLNIQPEAKKEVLVAKSWLKLEISTIIKNYFRKVHKYCNFIQQFCALTL